MKRSPSERRAFSVVELLAGIVLITVIVGGAALVLARSVSYREQAARQLIATETLANILEEIDSWTLQQITPARVAELTLPTDVAARLPGAALKIHVEDVEEDGLAAKKIHCEIAWRHVAGQPNLRVSVVTWRFEVVPFAAGS